MGQRQQAIPITKRALTQRVNRRLGQMGRRLVVRRSGVYIVEGERARGIELETEARALGVLQPWEQMV